MLNLQTILNKFLFLLLQITIAYKFLNQPPVSNSQALSMILLILNKISFKNNLIIHDKKEAYFHFRDSFPKNQV